MYSAALGHPQDRSYCVRHPLYQSEKKSEARENTQTPESFV